MRRKRKAGISEIYRMPIDSVYRGGVKCCSDLDNWRGAWNVLGTFIFGNFDKI